MKTILIDSDVLIEVSRGRDRAVLKQWEELGSSDAVLLCSPVTVAEIWHGARPKEHAIIEALFASLICVPINPEIGRRAGEYLSRHHASPHVELGDALIAATTTVHGAALWTRKRKHYPMPDVEFF
ncbi:MAG: type II toxin-antitoxin system VapC family toxin [Acidobacteriota bacterium]|mgnify:FL=1